MTGQIGHGSTVRIGRLPEGGGAPAWTKLALVGDLSAPDDQADEHETTHMESPGRRKEFIAGLIDSGELVVPHSYIPRSETHQLLTGIKATGENVMIELVLGLNGTPETWTGFCKGYARTAPVNGKMTAEARFRLSGLIENAGA